MKVIAIANQKGGVAKTTTTGAMAAGLKKRGYKILAIDLDHQANLTDSVGANNEEYPSIYEVLDGTVTAKEAIQQISGIDIIPANLNLAKADLHFTQTGKEYLLRESILPVQNDYDFVLIDTPPALGTLTVNAFTYANEVLIPTVPTKFAISGTLQLWETIQTVKKFCNPSLTVSGILFTRYNPRANISKEIRELANIIADKIKVRVYKTFIRASIMVDEAHANKTDIFTYNEKNTVAQDYNSFIDEYLEGEK